MADKFISEELEKDLTKIAVEPDVLTSSELDRLERREDDPMTKLCEIYCKIRPILKIASRIPGKIGKAIKSLMQVLDILCPCE